VNCFELNEELKERLVLECDSFFTKTKYFDEGVLMMPEPFYETIALWKPDVSIGTMKHALKIIKAYQKKQEEQFFMTDPVFEYNNNHPAFVWAIFPEQEAE